MIKTSSPDVQVKDSDTHMICNNFLAFSKSPCINLSKDDGYDKKQNGKSLLA
jgi:hypothetical protein